MTRIFRRWFASISDVTTNSIRIAVSKTNDPTGVWRTYNFPFESLPNNCSDQPFIAISDDKLVISVNTWSNNCDWSNDIISPKFRGVQFVVEINMIYSLKNQHILNQCDRFLIQNTFHCDLP
jgi:hypothetical protein